VNILLIVNESPWGSTLADTAARFLKAALAGGHRVPAVFFHGDGVYNALPGRATDAGAADLARQWGRLGRDHGVELLLCSTAAARRLPHRVAESLEPPFREAGLAELLDRAVLCDRVVSF
jgi:tRNA 2-thiouridine synthesizing protein D